MDLEQEELQSLGLFGICFESVNIISTLRKIFLKITLTLILPPSLVFLSLVGISTLHSGITIASIYNILFSKFPMCYLIIFANYTFLVIFLFPAIVYTIACAYSRKEITYTSVTSSIPKAWKRLMVTFLCYIIVLVVYTILSYLLLRFFPFSIPHANDMATGLLIVLTIFILYFIGLYCISMIWQLASVVSVIEGCFGFKAMTKSNALIKGKRLVSLTIFLVINLCLVGTLVMFQKYVVIDRSKGVFGKVAFAVLSLVLLCALVLFGVVAQTVIYFVCKSRNHEPFDKSTLSEHLEVYLGTYVPLKIDDTPMEVV